MKLCQLGLVGVGDFVGLGEGVVVMVVDGVGAEVFPGKERMILASMELLSVSLPTTMMRFCISRSVSLRSVFLAFKSFIDLLVLMFIFHSPR